MNITSMDRVDPIGLHLRHNFIDRLQQLLERHRIQSRGRKIKAKSLCEPVGSGNLLDFALAALDDFSGPAWLVCLRNDYPEKTVARSRMFQQRASATECLV